MLVKNLVPWAGERFSYNPGDVIDMPEDMAKARIEAGLASPHDGKAEKPAVLQHRADAASSAKVADDDTRK